MKTYRRPLLLLLCLALAFTALACASAPSDQTGTDTGSQASPLSGLVTHGSIGHKELPLNVELIEWAEDAMAREIQSCTLLYARDPGDGLWHCWLYVSSALSSPAYTFCEAADGTVLISASLPDADALGSELFYYFTLSRTSEPSFELTLNDDFAGLLLVRAASSVKK